MDITIRHGTPADAARLAEFAARTFRDAFAAENKPEDMALHLAKSFGAAQQTAEHGRGLARMLMTRVEAEARARKAGTLWLGVWERNGRARAFYRKCGFTDAGSQGFRLGTDPQTDRVLVRPVPPAP